MHSGDWDVAKNWSTGHVPGLADDVVIDTPGISVTHQGASDTINSLQSSDQIFMVSGALTIAAPSAVTNVLTLNGGILTGTGAFTVQRLEWLGGIMSGTGETDIPAGGTLDISSTALHLLDGRTLNNSGTTSWFGPDSLQVSNGAVVNNLAGGTFTAYGNTKMVSIGGSGASFNNAGTFIKANGGTSTIGTTFDNAGNVEVHSGTLQLAGGGTSGGTGATSFIVSDGSLQIANDYTLGDRTTLSLQGPMDLHQGRVSIPASATVSDAGTGRLVVSGGVLAVDGSLEANAPLELDSGGTISGGGTVDILDTTKTAMWWTGGAMTGSGTTHIAANALMIIDATTSVSLTTRTLRNEGTIGWSSGVINTSGGATIFNAGSGTFDIRTGNTVNSDGTATFHDQGRLVKSTGTGTTTFNIALVVDEASGSISEIVVVMSGTLVLAGGGHSGGFFTRADFLVDSGSVLDFANGYTLQDTTRLDGAGLIEVTGGNVSVPGFNTARYFGTGLLQVTGGDLNVDGTLEANGSMELDHGGTISGSGTVDLSEMYQMTTMLWKGGTMTGSGTTHIAFGSVLSIEAGDGGVSLAGGRTLNNEGTINWLNGSIDTSSGATIFNAGPPFGSTREGQFHILTDNAINSDGTATFDNQGFLDKVSSFGTTTFNIALMLDNGVLDVVGGTLALAGGGHSGGGVLAGIFTVQVGGVLNFANDYRLGNGTTISTAGLVEVTSGVVYIPFFATVSYQGSGLLQVDGDLDVDGTLEAYGRMELDGGLSGVGTLNSYFSFTWTGGSMSDSGTTHIAVFSQMIIDSPSEFDFGVSLSASRTLQNDGTIVWTNGGILASSGATIFNTFVGTFDIQTDTTIASDGTATFHDQGYLVKSAGTGTTTFNIALVDDAAANGIVEVMSGMLVLAGGGQSGGFFNEALFNVDQSATLDFTNNYTFQDNTHFFGQGVTDLVNGIFTIPIFNNGPTIDSGAQLNVIGGDLIVSGTLNDAGTLDLSDGATISGGGTVEVTNTMSWTGGTMAGSGTTHIALGASLAINAGSSVSLARRTLKNDGTITWLSGLINATGGATFMNTSMGSFYDANLGSTSITSDGTASFHNAGTFQKLTGAGTTTLDLAYFNDHDFLAPNYGTLHVTSGDLVLNGGGQSGGFFSAGYFNVDQFATVEFTNNYTFADGTHFSGSGVTDLVNGIFIIPIFNNGPTIDQGARLNVLGGDLIVSGTLTDSGFLELEPGGTISGGGTVEVPHTMLWTGGTMAGSGATHIAAGASLTINAGSSVSLAVRTLKNDGTISWSSGSINATGGATIANTHTGVFFDENASNTAINSDGMASFHNAGNFQKLNGQAATTLNLSYYNDHDLFASNYGTLHVSGGTLALNGGGQSGGFFIAGYFNVDQSATLQFTNNYTFQDNTHFSGLGVTQLVNGIFTIPIFNNGPAIDTGARLKVIGGDLIVSGTLTDSGYLELDAGGTISGGGNLNISGGQMAWDGGTMSGTGSTNISSGEMLINSSSGVTLDHRSLFSAGLVLWIGGNINAIGGATIHNNYNFIGGRFLAACTASIFSSDGSGSFSNFLGTFVKPQGTGAGTTTDIFVSFDNSFATIDAESGTLNLHGNYHAIPFTDTILYNGGTVNF
jgi:hypothetical protein